MSSETESKLSESEKNLKEVVGLFFSSKTSDLVLGLRRCLEYVDDPSVATLAALCLMQGLGSVPDPSQAVGILTRHCNDPRAEALLAECYIFGKGVEKDVLRGAELLESSKNSGDVYAYLVSGDCYHLHLACT